MLEYHSKCHFFIFVCYESIKREPNIKSIYECRCFFRDPPPTPLQIACTLQRTLWSLFQFNKTNPKTWSLSQRKAWQVVRLYACSSSFRTPTQLRQCWSLSVHADTCQNNYTASCKAPSRLQRCQRCMRVVLKTSMFECNVTVRVQHLGRQSHFRHC